MPKLSKKTDAIIDQIFQALPATTCSEIAESVSNAMGEEISEAQITNAMNVLREKAAEYMWTIPHVKRGIPGVDDTDRFRAVLVDKDGEPDFNATDREHVHRGTVSTVASIAAMSRHQNYALKLAADYETSPAKRRHLLTLARHIEFIRAEANDVLAELAA